jgi:hypothetical protein
MTGVAAEAVVTDHLTGSLEGIEELESRLGFAESGPRTTSDSLAYTVFLYRLKTPSRSLPFTLI